MKYTQFQAFEKHLSSAAPNHFSPVYAILAKDRFLRKTATERVISALTRQETNSGMSLKRFEDNLNDSQGILTELLSPGLFSKRQLIVIEFGDKTASTLLKELQTYLTNPNPETYLIISASALNSTTTIYKQIEKAGVILDLPEEKEWEKEKSLPGWVANKISSFGKTIDPQTCQYIVKRVGTDPGILDSEVVKLVCYSGDRQNITMEDVKTISTRGPNESLWPLGEVLLKRDKLAALQIGKALIEDGVSFFSMLRQLRNQFHTACIIASILASGQGPEEIIRRYPYMKGFILEKQIKAAQTYGLNRLQQAIQKMHSLEIMAKNSFDNHVFLAELLVLQLVSDYDN